MIGRISLRCLACFHSDLWHTIRFATSVSNSFCLSFTCGYHEKSLLSLTFPSSVHSCCTCHLSTAWSPTSARRTRAPRRCWWTRCCLIAVALLRFAEARPARAHPTDASPVLPALALWAVAPVRKAPRSRPGGRRKRARRRRPGTIRGSTTRNGIRTRRNEHEEVCPTGKTGQESPQAARQRAAHHLDVFSSYEEGREQITVQPQAKIP